jgi:AraC-like DNA-binding protein
MLAAGTEGVGTTALRERPEPPSPGPGEVVVHPEAIGICGSDYHLLAGELSDAATDSTLTEIALRAGYARQFSFGKAFKRAFGLSPVRLPRPKRRSCG